MLEVSIPELQIAGDMAGFAMRRFVDREYTAEDHGIIPWAYFNATTGVQANAPDGTTPTDHTPKLQALANDLAAWGGGVIKFRSLAGSINFGSSLILPMGVSIRTPAFNKRPVTVGPTVRHWNQCLRFMSMVGSVLMKADGTTVSVAVNGSCQDGYLIFGNVDPSVNATDYLNSGGIPGPGVGTVENIYWDGTPSNGVSCMRGAGPYQCKNWSGDMIATAYSRLTNLYTDKTRIETFNIYSRANNTSALLDLRGTGDAVVVGEIEAGYWDNGTSLVPAVGLLMSNCRGGRIQNLVNGVHKFTGGSAVTVANVHVEGGQIDDDNGAISLRDNHVHNGGGLPTPIIVRDTASGNGEGTRVIVDGTLFANYLNKAGEGHTGWSSVDKLDFLLEAGSGRMEVIDTGSNRRVVGVSGQLDKGTLYAPRIGTMVGGVETPLPELLNYGHMIQSRPFTIHNGSVDITGVIPTKGSWDGLAISNYTPGAGVTGVAFKGNTGTRYYKAQIVYDPVRRIGRPATNNAGVVSIAVTNGAAVMPRLAWAIGSVQHEGGYILEMYYSETGDDAFTGVCRLPVIQATYGIDNGECFASFPWTSRASGPMDPIQAGFCGDANGGALVYKNGNVEVIGSSQGAATIGTWLAGDIIWRKDAATAVDASGQALLGTYWLAGGTPGTGTPGTQISIRPMVAAQLPTAVPAGKTSGATEYNAVYTNEGATAISPFILPATVAGAKRTFVVQDADGIRVTAVAGSTIRIGSVVSASGGKIESTTIGSTVVLEAINTTQWVAISVNGNWDVT